MSLVPMVRSFEWELPFGTRTVIVLAEIERIASTSFAAGSQIVSDGLDCFKFFAKAGYDHSRTVVNDIAHPQKLDRFRWVNTVLSNLKTATSGTFHAIRRQYLHRYLAEFQYRFNRRSNLPDMLARLAYVAVRTTPRPYADIVCGYSDG